MSLPAVAAMAAFGSSTKIFKTTLLVAFIITIVLLVLWGSQDVRWLTLFYLVFIFFFVYSYTTFPAHSSESKSS